MLKKGVFYYPHANFEVPPQHILNELSPTSVLMDDEGGVWVTSLEELFYCPSLNIMKFNNEKDLSTKLYSLNYIPPAMIVNGLNNKLFLFKNKNYYSETNLPTIGLVNGNYSLIKNGNKIYVCGYGYFLLDSHFRL